MKPADPRDDQNGASALATRRLRVCHVAYTFYEADNRVIRYAREMAGRGHQVDGFLERARVLEQRRDVVEQDAGLGKVGDLANSGAKIISRHGCGRTSSGNAAREWGRAAVSLAHGRWSQTLTISGQ